MNISSTQLPVARSDIAPWRLTGIGILRIIFGLVWAVDAYFKWQPGFVNDFMDYVAKAGDGQAPIVQSWLSFWMNIIHVNPQIFAYLTAIGETAVAVGLIFGIFSNLTNVVGILLSVVIWSTAEGFGGPYVAGSTDIGAAIIYTLVFVGLFLSSAGLYLGLDRYLSPRLGRWAVIASGSVPGVTQPVASIPSSRQVTK